MYLSSLKEHSKPPARWHIHRNDEVDLHMSIVGTVAGEFGKYLNRLNVPGICIFHPHEKVARDIGQYVYGQYVNGQEASALVPACLEFGPGDFPIVPNRYLPAGMPVFCFEENPAELQKFVAEVQRHTQYRDYFGANPIFLLGTNCKPEYVKRAAIFATRNPLHTDAEAIFPKHNELKPGQRVVLLCNGWHVSEHGYYSSITEDLGYPHDLWRSWEKPSKPLPYEWQFGTAENSGGYILDYIARAPVVFDPCEE